jgi:hypothetical protein
MSNKSTYNTIVNFLITRCSRALGYPVALMSHLFASARRNAEFHSLFKNIPSDELLIDSKRSCSGALKVKVVGYSCALSREILIHGRLYLSASYVCFNANILGWVTNVLCSRICGFLTSI